MPNIKKAFFGVASVILLAPALAACGDSGGIDMEINAPILDAVGVNLMGKPKPEPDLAERAPLVMPPNKGDLPAPGEGQSAAATAHQQWPKDKQEQKKLAAKNAKSDKDKFCRDGDWQKSGATIDDYRKNAGQDTRCRPEWVDNVLGSRDEQNKK